MGLRLSVSAMAVGVSLLCVGCNQKAADEQLIGTWVAETQTLMFKPEGQFAIRKDGTDQTGTWELYGPEVLLKFGGKEMMCYVQSNYKNQLLVRTTSTEPRGCTLNAFYWHFDLPAEKRATALVAFDCQTHGQTIGPMAYTEKFRIEADPQDKLACFGKTDKGCQLIRSANIVSDDAFSMFVTWGNDTGEDFAVRTGEKPGELLLEQSSSQSCSTESGMVSCNFSIATPVGTCRKVAP